MYISSSLSRFDNVKRRQMLRMKKRSHWFLSPNDSYRLQLYPHVTMSPSQPTLGSDTGASVQIENKDRSETCMFDMTKPNNGLSRLPDADQTTLSGQQHFLIPHLEVTSPHDDEYQPLKNHLPTVDRSSSSELNPASFAQVPGSRNSNTVVGRDCAAGKR